MADKEKVIGVRCWKSDCPTPFFITPGNDNFTNVVVSIDGGPFKLHGLTGEHIIIEDKKGVFIPTEDEIIEQDEKTEFTPIETEDYLVVYCDSGHKNYIYNESEFTRRNG